MTEFTYRNIKICETCLYGWEVQEQGQPIQFECHNKKSEKYSEFVDYNNVCNSFEWWIDSYKERYGSGE